MLFNSYEFILVFLPITLAVYWLLGRMGKRASITWLVVASLFFYGWWNPAYLGLIIGSIAVNFGLGRMMLKPPSASKRGVLILGILLNLGALGYFKYANFFVDSLNAVFDAGIGLESIILPLAISFFTFQQITYLVDVYKGEAKDYDFLHYCLFVTFFPQLIAGPIVHHKEMMPQFDADGLFNDKTRNLAIGLTIFILGLFKKAVIADEVAGFSTPVFMAAEGGFDVAFIEAWTASLSYTFQLYFDFSGYSDMAIGLACMFGIQLPLNFFSPYKATSVIDFWRRWHMTLSRFLRDYLYIPLGGNRKGPARRYVNLMITMVLGGLWHGAGWTFVLWGMLHGLYLVVNNFWRGLRGRFMSRPAGLCEQWFGRLLTFLAVVVGWVFFRAESFGSALVILKGMVGMNGVSLTEGLERKLGGLEKLGVIVSAEGFMPNIAADTVSVFGWLGGLFVIIWFAPNSIQIMLNVMRAPALEDMDRIENGAKVSGLVWRGRLVDAVVVGALGVIAFLSLTRISEFLYFQF
ncbi:MBOAT family protein [Alphaproteobacteria bacterium]|nr:MBOAT family protein [Alphaproteobacteria bacterium]